jgi:hypothetical protein
MPPYALGHLLLHVRLLLLLLFFLALALRCFGSSPRNRHRGFVQPLGLGSTRGLKPLVLQELAGSEPCLRVYLQHPRQNLETCFTEGGRV